MSHLGKLVREFRLEILLLLALLIILGAAIGAARSEPLPYPKHGSCAAGYAESGGYCRPTSRDARRSFPKGTGQCPSGYAQSGASCQEIR